MCNLVQENAHIWNGSFWRSLPPILTGVGNYTAQPFVSDLVCDALNIIMQAVTLTPCHCRIDRWWFTHNEQADSQKQT